MIRLAKNEDLVALSTIEDKTFSDGHYSLEQLTYEYRDNPFAKILVDEEEIIRGFLIYMVTFNSATIVQIAVHPEYQRQGIATNLLKAMEKELLKPGYGVIENVTLEVRKKNKGAYALYAKNGYQDVCVKKGYYHNGDDAVYMMKVLL
ncbi:MAG: ribosomal protein S18-alanine N-acetyltransferase [Bacilli bacterium]|nr:ribosomal protein S18-alanine N-acetyltransferase [Bacilli bacterium]